MNHKKPGLLLAVMLVLSVLVLSACQQAVSTLPATTPTSITATGLFVTPLTAENPMEMIQEFAQGTAAAQTAMAEGGTPTTPEVIATSSTEQLDLTPFPFGTETPATPTNIIVNATPIVIGTATTPIVTTPIVVGTLPTTGPVPTTYLLQKGEFPYCIARRFNVNPDELLTLNGLTDGEVYYPNLTLKIPQTGDPFPAGRALHTHPATYTVPSSDTTLNGVACYYGDVDPAAIAAANGLTLSSALTTGQQLTIP